MYGTQLNRRLEGNLWIKKEERSQINNLNFHFEKLGGKNKQTKKQNKLKTNPKQAEGSK